MLKTYRSIIAILFLLMLCTSTVNARSENPSPLPLSGSLIDLRHHQWQQGNIFDLKGYWSFAWERLIGNQSSSDQAAAKWSKMHVPGSWDHRYFKGAEDTPPLPPKGYGTYHTRILVPKDLDVLYLYLPDMASAYELWSNGQQLGGNGVVATQKEQEQPAYLPRVYSLHPEQGVVDIYIQTSNFHYIWGGLWYAPRLTDHSGLFELQDFPKIRAISGATILIMSAIFCLLLYWSRPQDTKILYFSMFCAAIGVRRLCIDERILYLAEGFDWQTLQAMENISMYLMLPFFVSYVRHVFPNTIPRLLPALSWLSATPFILLVLFSEVETYAEFNIPFQLTLVIFLPIILIGWFRSLIAKHEGARMFGLSLCVFMVAIINDILNYNYLIQTTNLTHIGALAFVLFQIASMMNRYLSNFKKIETLSDSLAKQNKELKQLDQFKDDFLASTSHELKTPLHGIAGLAQTIGRHNTTLPENSQKQIRTIESTANRLGNLVNDILDTASLKHGKLDINLQPTALAPLIESAIQSLSTLAKDKGLSCHYQVNNEANYVIADEQRIHQVLFNLIGNAIKYTEQGEIQIKTERDNDRIRVCISDTGIGIPEDKLDDILQPFETASPQSHRIRGTGLGLPITQKLIELQHGELNISSKEGEGTHVEFTLPYSPEPAIGHEYHQTKHSESLIAQEDTQQHNIAAHPSQIDVNPLTAGALIYFADDEEVNRELVYSQLSEAGFTVEVFSSGPKLLEQIKRQQPELILLDWMMPGQSGLETCQEIRAQYNQQELPVIMLTAKHQTQDIVRALNSGANDYLTKPYHQQELIARVNSQVSCKRLTQTALENERLTTAIEEKDKEQKQLMDALNASDNGIALLNEDLDIEYANHALSKAFNTDAEAMLDAALSNYLNDQSLTQLQAFQNNADSSIELALVLNNQQTLNAIIERNLADDHENLILILKNSTTTQNDTSVLLSNLTKELAENRERMAQIEHSLRELNGEESITSPVKESIESTSTSAVPNELLVKTLKTALITWERYTHKTKVDLAEQSRCWRVYIDGTTAKTRTLDKYLSVKTLPAKPRWRAVVKTANFVLDNCELGSQDEDELLHLTQALKEAFA